MLSRARARARARTRTRNCAAIVYEYEHRFTEHEHDIASSDKSDQREVSKYTHEIIWMHGISTRTFKVAGRTVYSVE